MEAKGFRPPDPNQRYAHVTSRSEAVVTFCYAPVGESRWDKRSLRNGAWIHADQFSDNTGSAEDPRQVAEARLGGLGTNRRAVSATPTPPRQRSQAMADIPTEPDERHRDVAETLLKCRILRRPCSMTKKQYSKLRETFAEACLRAAAVRLSRETEVTAG